MKVRASPNEILEGRNNPTGRILFQSSPYLDYNHTGVIAINSWRYEPCMPKHLGVDSELTN